MDNKINKTVFVNHRTGEITYDNKIKTEWYIRGDEIGYYQWSQTLGEMVCLGTIKK
jgi:hypothetical protein